MSTLQRHGTHPSVGAELRELRRNAGLTGAAMARAAGWSQPKVSRIETGTVVPSEEDVRTWLALTGADGTRSVELWSLRDLAGDTPAPRVGPDGSAGGPVHSWRERYEQRVRRDLECGGFRSYQPGQIPTILMTRTFLRESLGEPAETVHAGAGDPDVVESITNLRVQHQDTLYNPDSAVQVVLGEAALYCRPGSVDGMIGQLERLLEVLDLPGLDLRVLPFHDRCPDPSSSPFVLYDDGVLLPALTADVWCTGAQEVGQYSALMGELSDRARVGDEVRATVERARGWHLAEFG